MDLKSQPLFRALGLLWGRMGAARIYVLVGVGGVVILAALGVVHLFSTVANPGRDPVHNQASVSATTPKAQPPPSAEETAAQEPLLAITEVSPRKRRLRDGSTSVTVKVGVAPRADSRKGEVEIRVFFYDVTRDNEMRPTDALVGYDWITPIRDWTDPAPKYLEATYLRPRTPRRAPERLRYGGFIVRVYLDGELQDERSEPKEILAALRAAQPPTANVSSAAPAPTATPLAVEETPPITLPPDPTPDARIAVTPPAQKTTVENASPPPYGSPVPDKPGFVYSPYNEKFLIDVRGVPPGTEVNDPNTGKPLRVP